MEEKMEEKVKDLNLLLMLLTGWEEDSRKTPGEKVFRAWKGYLFETLNKLADEKLIIQFQNTKSVTLTEAGRQKAEQLKKQYLHA
jgi:UTP:GlnB (protein PII) uridylyltransferase